MRSLAAIVALTLGLGSSACQPLYGNKPDKLVTPSKKKRPPEEKIVAPEVKYVEECASNFRDDPKTAPRPEKAIASKLLGEGDAAFDKGKTTKDPAQQAQAYKDAVDRYSSALRKDPYNADITIALALAYDAVYRKGCALAMLRRLDALTKNPKVSPNASATVSKFSDNPAWFKGYRNDAQKAIGL